MIRPQPALVAVCVIVGAMITSVIAGNPALRASQENHDHSKHEMIMNVLRDSVMLDLMMDHIASDSAQSITMVERLVYYAVGDTSRMERLCSTWMENKSMRSLMMRQLRNTNGNVR